MTNFNDPFERDLYFMLSGRNIFAKTILLIIVFICAIIGYIWQKIKEV